MDVEDFMDPIASKLGQLAHEKIRSSIQIPDAATGGKPQVQSAFDQTLAERLLEKLKGNDMSGAQDVTALSADDIKVQTVNEMGEGRLATEDRLFDMFKSMNKDMTSLDSAIETLTTPGVSMSPRQLLSLQAGIANTSIMAEAFSKFTDGVARGMQTIVQTQVG